MMHRPDLVVISHLRWDFVWQRPQHLMTRLAQHRRVFFVEEPLRSPNAELSWNCRQTDGLTVCQPLTPAEAHGYNEEQFPRLRRLLQELFRKEGIRNPIVWFYTPMAFPLIDAADAQIVVYDCMDELSAFKGAPPEMLQREKALLKRADVVFTGGPSLYEAKKNRHPNAYCFSSSVDRKHFGKALDADLAEPADQASLPHPRLGFFGVIDERFDVPLLAEVAKARPEWHFSLVGPVVKIDPATLPKADNIHYFGQRDYKDLPAFLKGWDVALLPFARNESTKFISPTKTLEYMAAERLIVSTPITDVAKPYGDIVYLANNAQEFIAACEKALNASEEERNAKLDAMRGVLAKTSWDQTASEMNQIMAKLHLDATSANQRTDRGQTTATQSPHVAAAAEANTPPVVVVGAGPTGLSTAYHLGDQALLLEKNETVGGWCRSIEDNGFTFDFAGHIMFSNDPYVHEMYKMLLGDNIHWQNREAWIYSKNVYTRYPFQGALYGLPPEVIKDCIMGAIESRFGPLKKTGGSLVHNLTAANGNGNGHAKAETNGNGHSANGNGHAKSPAVREGDVKDLHDCCADGVMESTAKLECATNGNGHAKNGHGATAKPTEERGQNFEEFIYKVWGAGIAKHFAIPYNRKLWAVPLTEMETSWLGGRVPMPDLEEMIDGALQPVPAPMGPNARFGYPLRGGFQALMNGFKPLLKGPVRLGESVAKVSPSRKVITLKTGEEIPFQQLVSTMPLPVLVRMMGDEAPAEVKEAAAGLRYISVRCVNIGVGRENLTEKHWLYYPEDSIFHRIFVQGNASPHCNPPGGFGFTCEITYSPEYKPLPCEGQELIQRCIEDCKRVGFIREDDPIWAANEIDMPHAYVVYDHARPKNVATIRNWLAQHDVILAGRYSEWEYYNSDHAFLAGKKAAEKVKELRTAPNRVAASLQAVAAK
ncbi:MAG: FAD-dependent oxidoreductase [Gemmataceae bacterium]|nr:FAD-dependent oxidoreductase [Gemmataceae bacterium]